MFHIIRINKGLHALDSQRKICYDSSNSIIMPSFLTPKSLAQAIGVSESSLRRWVDSGSIPITRTVGGHRRIAWADAIRFIRQSNSTVVRPELMGFREAPASARRADGQDDGQRLFRALHAGLLDQARGLIFSQYLTGASLSSLFDGPIRLALHRIGELWHHDPRGILIEHRAIDICLQILNQLRQTVPHVAPSAPAALGGAPQGDSYLIPSLMAATIAAEAGFRDINFGPETPLSLLGRAEKESSARLVWLALSVLPADGLHREILALHKELAARDIPLVLGGRYAPDLATPARRGLHVVNSMAEFAAFLAGLTA